MKNPFVERSAFESPGVSAPSLTFLDLSSNGLTEISGLCDLLDACPKLQDWSSDKKIYMEKHGIFIGDYVMGYIHIIYICIYIYIIIYINGDMI